MNATAQVFAGRASQGVGGPRVLFIRTDAIGDAVLAMDQLRLVHEQLPTASLAVACTQAVSGLYGAAPFPLQILDHNPARFRHSWAYRVATLRRLRAFRPTHVLNGMVTRTTVCDFLALGAGAPVRIGWAQSGARRLRDRLLDRAYTALIPATNGNELLRNSHYLVQLGLQSEGYAPRVWWAQEDEFWARSWLKSEGIPEFGFVLLFAGAQHVKGGYVGYADALNAAFPAASIPVVAVGSSKDLAANQAQLECYLGPGFNLCGNTSLPRLAALAKQSGLAFGADTGVSHVACAVGVPQVVLIGGGHFGRFHPYSPLTTLACLPLDCFGCDWVCRYSRAHCIHEVPPQVLAEAIRSAWQASHDRPQIYYPLERRLPAGPHAASPEGLPCWVQARWVAVRKDGRESDRT